MQPDRPFVHQRRPGRCGVRRPRRNPVSKRNRIAWFPVLAAVAVTMNCSTIGGLFAAPTATPTFTPTATNTPSQTPGYVPTEEDLTGSRWEIVSQAPNEPQLDYFLIFHEGGVLENTHPNDKTYDNDTWSIEGEEIVIRFNDGYAVYRGTFMDRNTMSGTATNQLGHSWEWTASRRE
jgi:hypothetical protein